VTAVAAPRGAAPRPPLLLAAGLVAGAALFGLVAGQLVESGRTFVAFGLALVLLPVAVWKRPAIGPAIVLGSALTIEQFPAIAGSRTLGFSARLPLFHGLGGYRPSDLLLLLLLAAYLAKRGTSEVVNAPRSALAKSIKWLSFSVGFAILYGVGTGGIVRVALTEARPFLYLGAAYLIASTFVTSRRVVHSLLWTLVIGSGLKALEGLTIFLSLQHTFPRPDSILGHEESFFFGMFVLLTLALWIFDVPGSLRTTATWLLPVVLAADLVNGRRTAWLILPVGIVITIAVGIVCNPRRRPFLIRLAVVLAFVSAVYLPVYWNKTGGLSQPARAVHSAISPDPRDASSNLYRVQEDANLKYNIARAGPLGTGFGHRIDYALPIVDISSIDPYIAYIPHNGVFWIFLRLGVPGATVFWILLGLGTIAGCRLAKSSRGEFAAVGMLTACAIPAYALLGYNDQGFFYYRVAFVVGTLLGLTEAARRIDGARER
jgi:hypothetical protein